jgi:peptidoglycan/LPS O-acetylase OafA/YrhL/lysophospholipase L1-like esterase
VNPPATTGLRHAVGLDGVRALAVAAVFAYHLGTTSGVPILSGGFLGVDVFFVLSGYLITSLLIVEARRTGRISIKNFYLRRARRLLPALYALLLVVGAISVIWIPEQAARLRGDLVAALTYVTNWWLVHVNGSYFAGGGDRPQLLTHLWSLAVEEQFYLIWPVILIICFRLRVRRRVLVPVVLGAVAASTIAAWLLYDPFSDPSRVYYGTDTRALAPLLGAAVAIVFQPWRHRADLSIPRRLGLDVFGLAGLAALGLIAWRVHDTDAILYGAGFLVIAALGGVVVLVAGHPASLLGKLLGLPPLRWLGDRSYAIYLWHWPVCVLTRPTVDVALTGWADAVLRILLTLALAEASYWLVEKPIRRYGFFAPLFKPVAKVPAQPVAIPTQSRVVASVPAAGIALQTAGPGTGHTSAALFHPTAMDETPPLDKPGVYTSHRVPRRSRSGIARTVVMSLVLALGGAAVGTGLTSAAADPVPGGPVDLGPERTLGPLPSASPTLPPSKAPPPLLKAGATVAFFGDSQGMTLLLNQPADTGKYIKTVDATISGCGVLLGAVVSRTGEKRNLSANCRNWQSVWAQKVNQIKPAMAIIMIGAWDVFDLTVDSGAKLPFGSPEWNATFTDAMRKGIETLRAGNAEVALALLPCYRPIKASAGFWPERGDDARTRHINDLLRTIADTYPSGVRTLEPPAQFCTDPAIGSDTSYRWDGVHYYKKGAALYFTAVLPQLTAIG